jgi:hypothetical protein
MSLSANKTRVYEGTPRRVEMSAFGMAAGAKAYDGSALGLVAGTGLVRALVAGDKFVGFSDGLCDNTNGAAAAVAPDVQQQGYVQLSVTGATITDVDRPVYASDDDTFSFSPVAGSFVGFMRRFVSAGVAIVAFDANTLRDPYAGYTHVLKSANYTVAATDTGKWIWVDTDAVVITLPAVEGINFVRVGNLGSYGTVGFSVAPDAADMIEGPGITAADNKAIINTKATANRGDFIEIAQGDANGWSARFNGTFARAA